MYTHSNQKLYTTGSSSRSSSSQEQKEREKIERKKEEGKRGRHDNRQTSRWRWRSDTEKKTTKKTKKEEKPFVYSASDNFDIYIQRRENRKRRGKTIEKRTLSADSAASVAAAASSLAIQRLTLVIAFDSGGRQTLRSPPLTGLER